MSDDKGKPTFLQKLAPIVIGELRFIGNAIGQAYASRVEVPAKDKEEKPKPKGETEHARTSSRPKPDEQQP